MIFFIFSLLTLISFCCVVFFLDYQLLSRDESFKSVSQYLSDVMVTLTAYFGTTCCPRVNGKLKEMKNNLYTISKRQREESVKESVLILVHTFQPAGGQNIWSQRFKHPSQGRVF